MTIKLKEESNSFSSFTIIAIMAFAFIILVMRRTDIVTHAQPWAEDGSIWMAGIYNDGFWSSLAFPQNGYYQTISRITYGIALMFGVSNAALIANIIAIVIRCIFVGFILSDRVKFIDIKFRLAAVLYFIIMPNLAEGFVNITNAHWYLSMYLLTVVMANEPDTRLWKVHDFALIIISGLSGPFVIFIAPCLIIKRIYQRGGIFNSIKGINAFDVCMAFCCMIQVAAILLSPETARSSAPLGASIGILIKIISYRVIGGTFLPNDMISFMPYNKWLSLGIFILFFIPLVYFITRSGWRFKVAFIFPALMFGFALAKPMMSLTEPQWPVFFGPGNGERYFFITNFSFFCFVLYAIHRTGPYNKQALLVLSLVTVFTCHYGFYIPPYADVGYKDDLNKLKSSPPGKSVSLRINPPGWTMKLIKK
ncbi:MAG: glucosyl transferase [Pantoea sp.]|uniref:glucosyl transferase n=1 Tax=Pantoea sp. TaxID=69393 RepID=UPI0039E29A14